MRPIRLCFAAFLLVIAALAARHAHASACSPFTPAGTVDVFLSDGTCKRFFPGTGVLNIDNNALTVGRFITHVKTGANTGAWVCGPMHPTGFDSPGAAPDSPCWELNATGYTYRRIRGARSATYPYGYIAAENTNVVLPDGSHGYSIVISGAYGGNLPSGPPSGTVVCPVDMSGGMPAYLAAYNFTFVPYTSDTGLPEWIVVPKVGGNPVSAGWPTGGYGRACLGYGGDGNYATITYQSDANLY